MRKISITKSNPYLWAVLVALCLTVILTGLWRWHPENNSFHIHKRPWLPSKPENDGKIERALVIPVVKQDDVTWLKDKVLSYGKP